MGDCQWAMETPLPPLALENRTGQGGSCLLPSISRGSPISHSWVGMEAECPLSQVECFETGSREFLQTTNLVKDSKSLTKEPESVSCRWSSKIPNFCLGSRKHSKGKEGKSLYVSMQHKEVRFSLTTQLSGSYFYGGKTLTPSECCWWQGIRERTEERELRPHAQLLPLAKRLPVNQTVREERQKQTHQASPSNLSLCPSNQIHKYI